MTALLCEEYQWSNYSYIGRPRRRPVLIFHRLPRERSERAPKSTANNGSSEPPLRHAPRGLSEQTAKHWLSPRRAENRDKMIKNCQAGLAITRSAVSPRQDKSLRFFSSLLSLCEPPSGDVGGRVGSRSAPSGSRAPGSAGVVATGHWPPGGQGCVQPAGSPAGTLESRHSPPVGPSEPAPLIPPRKTGTPVGGCGLGRTCEDTPGRAHPLERTCPDPPARDTSGGSPGLGAPPAFRNLPPDPALSQLGPSL